MIIGAVAAYNNVNNFTQQQAVVATPPASIAFDIRNSAIAQTQTRQAVKVSDSSNKGEGTREQKEVRSERRASAGSRRPAHRGTEIDLEV